MKRGFLLPLFVPALRMRPGRNKRQKQPLHAALSRVLALHGVVGEPRAANRLAKMYAGLLQEPSFLAQVFCRGIAGGVPRADPSAAKRRLQSARMHVALGSPKHAVSSSSRA